MSRPRGPRSAWGLVPLVTALAGCVGAADLPGSVSISPSVLCAASLPPGDVERVAEGFSNGTRGIAFSPDGRLFVTHGDAIEEVLTDGSHGALATVPGAAGMEWWSGQLAVATPEAGGDGGLVRVDVATGETVLFVSPLPGAESATLTPWRTLAVASPTADQEVVEVLNDGGLDGFIQEVPAPFGVAFTPEGDAAWVSSSSAEAPTLWRFPIVEDGIVRGDPFLEWDAPVGAAEAVVSTTDDAVYVALSAAGRIARVDPETAEETDVGTELVAPTGIALGTGDWDPCALYVTSPSSDAVFAVGVSR
ncbi:MAG: hypothetical protein KDA24_15245 [Deltaproteobacteria bacterium]|nr:hypothetical protein [Deltaproteobacteria bacterium]